MSDPLASWSIPERESLKDCIRLGIWSFPLAQTALPARSVGEIAQVYAILQTELQRYWSKLQLSPSTDESEMQFTLACLWDLGKRVKQGKAPTHDLCPTLPKEQERQLKQLIQRYRKDSKQIAAQLMSPKKQGAVPSRYNIQLIPKNAATEVQMARFGYNSKLQLNVGKTKKISSVIVHLQKKWKAAVSSNITLRLYPAVQGGVVVPNFSWTENDKCVIVSRIYTLLQCRQGVIRLDYELVDDTQPPAASSVPHNLVSEELLMTPSLEANFSEFLNDIENIDSSNLSTPTPTPPPPSSSTLFPPQEEDQNFLSDLPGSLDSPGTLHMPIEIDVGLPPSTLPDDVLLPLPTNELSLHPEGEVEDLLPATPFQPRRGGTTTFPTSFDELSQDAFHLRDREYEGKCREYWYQCEESLDYSSYFSPAKRSRERPGQGPSKKKQKLSLHPL